MSKMAFGPTAAKIVILDTVVALLVEVVMFAIIFSFDVEYNSGPIMMFQILPISGILMSLFFGWVLGEEAMPLIVGTSNQAKKLDWDLLWVTRVIAPLAIIVILTNDLIEW